MTRDEAIATLRVSLMGIQYPEARAAAFQAFDALVHDVDAGEQVVLVAYEELIRALPDHRHTIDRIMFSRRTEKTS